MDIVKSLVDLVVTFLHLFRFWTVVDQWEKGVVLRLGSVARRTHPGLNWHFPFLVDRVITEAVYDRPAILQSQSLTTADGVQVIITPIVLFRVRDAKRLILRSGGHEEAIVAAVAGVVTSHVTGATWGDLEGEEFRKTVLADAEEKAAKWGIQVLDITWKDLVKTRTYRLIQEQNHQ